MEGYSSSQIMYLIWWEKNPGVDQVWDFITRQSWGGGGEQVVVHQTGWLSQQNHTSHFVCWSSSCLGNHRDTGAHCAWLLWSFSSCLQEHCPTTRTVTAPTAERPPPLSGGGILKASTCAMPVVSTTVSMAPTETTHTRRRWGVVWTEDCENVLIVREFPGGSEVGRWPSVCLVSDCVLLFTDHVRSWERRSHQFGR